MADIVEQILAGPIQLADMVTKTAEEASNFRQECLELKAKTERLAALLRQAARSGSDLYERPTRRIMDDTEQALDKALDLVLKCRAHGLVKRLFTIIPAAAFRKMSSQLENSIGDVSWLLRVSAPAGDRGDEYLGLPPIAANEPILCLIWEQIAILCAGSADDRSDAAASLVSLARDNDRYGKLIVEEGGVPPLLKLAKEGHAEGQDNAARAIGLLGRDPGSAEQIVKAGVGSAFAKILKDGSMRVQATVAWAVSELAENLPSCQDHFAQNNLVRMLVGHLAFETIQEHSKYAIAMAHKQQEKMSIHSVLMASQQQAQSNNNDNNNNNNIPLDKAMPSQMHNMVMALKSKNEQPPQNNACTGSVTKNDNNNNSSSGGGGGGISSHQNQRLPLVDNNQRARASEDPQTKAHLKAMAARALWKLCKGNRAISFSVTESRALLCFAVLLERGREEVQYNCAAAVMEITAVAEHNPDLRRAAFKPNAPAAKAVFEQLLRIVERADSEPPPPLLPCVQAIGNLARTFRATETRIIGPLVRLLDDEREPEVMREAVVALTKFACSENYLHMNHSRAVIDEGGPKHLIQLVYFSEQSVQLAALTLLCYVALHVPDSETLAKEEVLIVLEWGSKQAHLAQDELVESLLPEAKGRLELYQSRGTRGFH